MVVDTIENLGKYVSLNPLFVEAANFLGSADLNSLQPGKIVLKENELIVNVAQTTPKSKEEAKLETHNRFIDIQIPLTGTETMGYTAARDCLPANAPYDSGNDITFFDGAASDYITVRPGMFVIFFPQDGHAPGISESGIKKIIVKVKA